MGTLPADWAQEATTLASSAGKSVHTLYTKTTTCALSLQHATCRWEVDAWLHKPHDCFVSLRPRVTAVAQCADNTTYCTAHTTPRAVRSRGIDAMLEAVTHATSTGGKPVL